VGFFIILGKVATMLCSFGCGKRSVYKSWRDSIMESEDMGDWIGMVDFCEKGFVDKKRGGV